MYMRFCFFSRGADFLSRAGTSRRRCTFHYYQKYKYLQIKHPKLFSAISWTFVVSPPVWTHPSNQRTELIASRKKSYHRTQIWSSIFGKKSIWITIGQPDYKMLVSFIPFKFIRMSKTSLSIERVCIMRENHLSVAFNVETKMKKKSHKKS